MSAFLQIEGLIGSSVEPNENVVFDTVVVSTGNISYDNTTGIITILDTGIYEFDWWVATQSTISATGAGFVLVSSQGDGIIGNSPAKIGEVVGMGIIEILTVPATISLRNTSGASVYYSSIVSVKGSLKVLEVGTQGATGATGPAGPTGAGGPTGPTGPAGDVSSIEIIPTANRYFYFPPTNLDLSSSVTVPAEEFIDDNGNNIAQFSGLGTNSYSNLFINGLMQQSSIYILSPGTLFFPAQSDIIFAGTPIIIETVQFDVQI